MPDDDKDGSGPGTSTVVSGQASGSQYATSHDLSKEASVSTATTQSQPSDSGKSTQKKSKEVDYSADYSVMDPADASGRSLEFPEFDLDVRVMEPEEARHADAADVNAGDGQQQGPRLQLFDGNKVNDTDKYALQLLQ